jgi:hypothetical protein
VEEEEEIVEVKKPKEVSKFKAPIKKKESSGFGLFSFMNNVKPRHNQKQDDDEIEEEQENKKLAKSAQKNHRHEEFAHKPHVKEQPKEDFSKAKISNEAEKKRQKFFGSTIFDESNPAEESGKIDDDILNVPAFFRRKK